LLLAQLPASVAAIRTETVRAPVGGILRLLPAARRSGPLAQGTAWASLEPEASPAEARELEQAEKDFAERRARYRAYELPVALEKSDADIAAARETLALARFADGSPDLFTGETPILDPRLKPAATRAQAEARLRAAEDRRKALEAGDPAADPADIQAAAATLNARKRALAGQSAPREISAAVTGTLRLAVSPEAGGTRVEAGAVLGTLQDDTALEVVVRGTLPLLHAVPADGLFCTVAASGGAEATASFSAWGVESSGSGVVPVIRFRLPSGAFAGERGNLDGVEMAALVYVKLPEEARIVPKLALAEWDADGVLAAGWRPGLLRLFPGSRLLAEGRAAVAVVPR
jgi:hypothetical protein